MKRSWTWAILLIALMLIVACRPAADSGELEDLDACPPGEEVCTTDETANEEPAPAPTTPAATDAPQPTAKPVDLGADPLAIRDGDWVSGSQAEDPLFTLVEYGDFL